MATKLERILEDYYQEAYLFECPGCGIDHMFVVKVNAEQLKRRGCGYPTWSFNGNLESPTFQPSLLVRWNHGPELEPRVCHSLVKDGNIQFLSDCTHALAGKTVPLKDIQA